METIEIVGWERKDFSKSNVKALRKEGHVPCVLYSKNNLVHFHAPMILFRELVYTPNAYFVDINVEGKVYKAILQDIQFHPVSEIILHADFLELVEGEPVTLDIPVGFKGTARGVTMGGKLYSKLRKLKVRAMPDKMPSKIEVDVTKLRLGQSVKVGSIVAEDFEILNNPSIPVASVEIPRALRSMGATDDDEEDEEGEGTEEAKEEASE